MKKYKDRKQIYMDRVTRLLIDWCVFLLTMRTDTWDVEQQKVNQKSLLGVDQN